MNQTAFIFFNHWHNGDLFITRALVSDIISQLPQFKFFYAHNCHEKAVQDIVEYISNNKPILSNVRDGTKSEYINGSYVFNTWVGAWQESWRHFGHNFPNYIEYYEIYNFMYDYLRFKFGLDLTIKDKVWDYIPDIEYNRYNIKPVQDFIRNYPKFVLFSNNDARSLQTNIGNMKEIIEELAVKFDGLAFVATQRFETTLSNIFFTSDIIKEECDLNEISYMSTLCPVIVGKNSSPSTYFNTKHNYKDPNKIIIDFSKDIRDCLPNGLDMPAEFRFSDSVDNNTLVDIVSCAIKEKY